MTSHRRIAFWALCLSLVAGTCMTQTVLAARGTQGRALQLAYSSYLGTTGRDEGLAVAVDRGDIAYVAAADGPSHGTVTKISIRDHRIVYRRQLPGRITAISVDAAGNAYVTGQTYSTTFPTLHAFQTKMQGAPDAFVVKLNSSGKLLYSGYLGGEDFEAGTGIAVDRSGNAYVTGFTYSSDFPLRHPFQMQRGSGGEGNTRASDAFLSKVSPTGKLVYSTFLGGAGNDEGFSVTVDHTGDALIAGLTSSVDFPLAGALQGRLHGQYDAFVTKVSAAGNRLVFSTYLGGSEGDWASGIASDGRGAVYVTGVTGSHDFPMANAPPSGRETDAFVIKLASGGHHLIYSAYLGGKGTDQATGIALDRAGNAYVTGFTNSPDFPTLHPLQSSLVQANCDQEESSRVCYDAFAAKIGGTDGHLLYGTYLGGNRDDMASGIAVNAQGKPYLAGTTSSTNFPIVRALQAIYPARAGSTVFVAAFRAAG